MWISLADIADNFLVFAWTDLEKKKQRDPSGISAFIIERAFKGFSSGTLKEKWGILAGNTGFFKMEDVEVPEANLVGRAGEGFKIAMFALDQGRFTVAAGATGLIRACRDASAKYAKERQAFGVAIAEHQLVKEMIAQMESDYQVARLLWMRSGFLKNRGRRNTRETGLAKWFATVASERAAGDAVQVHGANGYSDEYPVGRFYRNCKGAVIYEGTREIHKLMQADYVLGFREDRPTRCELPKVESCSSDLSLEFLRVVEQAAIACAHTMGQGDGHQSDQAAVEAMRRTLDSVPIEGTIVIGEGERDEAPMLYIGETVGLAAKSDRRILGLPEVDIAVDPLEGTNLCATGAANALAVLAASDRGGLLHAPDLYMEKLVVGASSKGSVSLDAPVAENLRAIARCLDREVTDLVVIVLDRPRHERLIQEIRETGARIRLISDGDLSAGIAAAVVGSGVHAVMGTGGAPEGVITAAAMRCLNGEIFARLVVTKPEHEERCRAMGIEDFRRVYTSKDLASGDNLIFAATGVTDGALLKGVRFFGDGTRTMSLVMQTHPARVRFIDTIHVEQNRVVRVRF